MNQSPTQAGSLSGAPQAAVDYSADVTNDSGVWESRNERRFGAGTDTGAVMAGGQHAGDVVAQAREVGRQDGGGNERSESGAWHEQSLRSGRGLLKLSRNPCGRTRRYRRGPGPVLPEQARSMLKLGQGWR